MAILAYLDTVKELALGQPYVAAAILGLTVLLAYDYIERASDVEDQPNGAKAQSKAATPRPPRVSYLLPWIGSAIAMGKNPDAFFERASSALGPIFKVKAVGKEFTYITSPDLISALYRDAKTFEFTPIRLDMSQNIFGMSHAAAYSSFMMDQYLPLHHRELSPKKVVGLLQRYTEYARECILNTVENLDGKSTPLVSFLIPPAYASASLALFGRSFDAEKSYKPFRGFDDYFHIIVAGVPRFMMPGPHRAWDQVGKMFEDYLQTPHEDSSELMKLVETGAKDAGWSTRDIARSMATELWALEANAIWAAYWTVALELRKSQGLTALIAEIDNARTDWETTHPGESLSENLHQWLSGAPLPLLTSTIQEALRLSTSTFSIRRVSEPVDFAGYHFDTGERIICATRAVHLDEDIHHDAQEFVAERYLDSQKKFVKNGKVVPNHTMPFGGGVSMCEGRHFALGELKIYLALILSYATIELDLESTTKPRYYTERMGAGLMPPVGDLGVKIHKRNVV